MDNWDQEMVDLVEPGFIEFDEDGLGGLGFIAVTGELDCRDADRDGRPGVEFSWQGSDEGDDVSGRGWAALNPDGTLEGTSTSTLVMIPRSAPSGSAESSGERPPVAPNAACWGAGIRDHGGVPDDELLERVRELRARGRSPKEIARALKVRPATVTPLIRRLAAAEPREEVPLIGCWVNQGWSSSVRFTGHPEWPDTGAAETGASGLVIVVVARERGSSVRVCEFLVDTWCLGVKNALGPKPVERRKLPSFCADAFRSYPGAPVAVPLVLAQRVVFGAVGYARGLGFEPHADFAKAAGHLGEWDGVCDLEFGRDGMPMYIEGPHDDTWRIMHTLRQNVGDGNFHYLAGLRP
jgi:hypothetical protein